MGRRKQDSSLESSESSSSGTDSSDDSHDSTEGEAEDLFGELDEGVPPPRSVNFAQTRVPKGYTPLQASGGRPGTLSLERIREAGGGPNRAELWLVKMPHNFDIRRLDGVSMQVPESALQRGDEPNSGGAPRGLFPPIPLKVNDTGRHESRTGTLNSSAAAHLVQTPNFLSGLSSVVNMFPGRDAGDKKPLRLSLGRPFARQFSVVDNELTGEARKIDEDQALRSQVEATVQSNSDPLAGNLGVFEPMEDPEAARRRRNGSNGVAVCTAPAQKRRLMVRTFPIGHPARGAQPVLFRELPGPDTSVASPGRAVAGDAEISSGSSQKKRRLDQVTSDEVLLEDRPTKRARASKNTGTKKKKKKERSKRHRK